MAGKCVFNDLWLTDEKYSSWLSKPGDRHQAYCKFCLKTLQMDKMGESALKSHIKGKKHLELAKARATSVCINDSFVKTKESSSSSIKNAQNPFAPRNDVLDAEIVWAIRTVTSHSSYKSNEKIEDIFRQMFSDSNIALNFTCGEKKTAYYSVFGVAPYLKDLLLRKVENQKFVLLFDESLNRQRQKKQMDMHIRIWTDDNVQTRYLTSEFLGHSTAEDMFESLYTGINFLKWKDCVQISMDGPNVNWKVFSMLQEESRRFLEINFITKQNLESFENEKYLKIHSLNSIVFFTNCPNDSEYCLNF